jgi:predicted alpha/beta-fold hydrolase
VTPADPGPPPEPFRPAPGLQGPHRQTLIGRFVRSAARADYARESLETPDGDRLSLDRAVAGPRVRAPGADAPVLLVLHGLEGSSESGYARLTAREALRGGLRPYVLNFRSCDGGPNRRLRSYHSGETGDPALAVAHLRRRHPGATLLALGYSLGGNVLLDLLAEPGGADGITAAAAVSVPYDLAAGARHLERPAAAIYTRYFLLSLRRKAREKARRFPGRFDASAASRARTLRAFDDAFTAPVHGFTDAEDYYARASSLPRLGRIRTPTLLAQAEDDPFLPRETLDAVRSVRNPSLRLAFSKHGGHLGFLASAGGGRPRPWVEPVAVAWLAERAREASDWRGPLEPREETRA